MLRIKSKIQEKLIETRKNGQIRGTLKRRLMTNFLLTALIPVLIFAIISQINIQQRLKEIYQTE